MGMIVNVIKRVLTESIGSYAARQRLTEEETLKQIRTLIDATSAEYRKDDPTIEYEKPLCRLGYLYRQAPANAALFRAVMLNSQFAGAKLKARAGNRLRICTVGGGPGTELLGLAKFYLTAVADHFPQRIDFAVIDKISAWAETWEQIADSVEVEFKKMVGSFAVPPVICPVFLQMDVVDPDSYRNYAYKFEKVDLVVFNYLFSENKTRINDCGVAVQHLFECAPSRAVFVVIDRLEAKGTFQQEVLSLLKNAGLVDIEEGTIDSCLDSDEDVSDFGDPLLSFLGRPRTSFHTSTYRNPTVFWYVAAKP